MEHMNDQSGENGASGTMFLKKQRLNPSFHQSFEIVEMKLHPHKK